MNKHTPGPWKVITEADALKVDVFEVAEISHFRVIPDRPDTWETQGDAFEDARLIAAAPELLETLRLVAKLSYGSPHNHAIQERVRAVIAKVEGGDQ